MTSNTSNLNASAALTDGETIYYPTGAGQVRTIGVETLRRFAEDNDGTGPSIERRFHTHTRTVGVEAMAVGGTGPDLTFPRALVGMPDASADEEDPIADYVGAWLDWCDEQEEAADRAA